MTNNVERTTEASKKVYLRRILPGSVVDIIVTKQRSDVGKGLETITLEIGASCFTFCAHSLEGRHEEAVLVVADLLRAIVDEPCSLY